MWNLAMLVSLNEEVRLGMFCPPRFVVVTVTNGTPIEHNSCRMRVRTSNLRIYWELLSIS